MTTMAIDRYALANGLPVAAVVEAIGESRETSDVRPTTLIPVAELDAVRATIYETATDDLTDAREALEYAREDVRGAERNLKRSVREALDEGVPATHIAKVLNVSRARVYQLRDGKR